MREARQVKPALQLQVAHPPDWLPEAHTSADLGEYWHFLWAPQGKLFVVHRGSTDPFVVQVVLDITFRIPNRKKTS